MALSNETKSVFIFRPRNLHTVTLDGAPSSSSTATGWSVELVTFDYLFNQHLGHKIKQFVSIQGGNYSSYSNMGYSAVIYDDGALFINKTKVAGTFEAVFPSMSGLNVVSGLNEAACFYARQTSGTIEAYDHLGAPIATTWPSGFDRYSFYQGNGVYSKNGKWYNHANTDLGFKAPSQSALRAFVPFVSHSKDVLVIPVLP
jgi:hypothetical protein